jgi:hypothetical protein
MILLMEASAKNSPMENSLTALSPQPATTKQQEREEDRDRHQRRDTLPPLPVRASRSGVGTS